ncbi:MAG: acyl-CoA synthetase [Deltaproteobacteria bacterium]|nr:acyl-CoA synthetase [Deltaproteobacteria bacterium]
MGVIGLAALIAGARPDTHPIAFHKGEMITLARLRGDVAHNADLLLTRRVQRGAMVCADAYPFIVGLLALIRIGAGVILPSNEQPGTLHGLQPEFDALVTDSDATHPAHRIALESAEAGPFDFDPARSPITFFTSGSTGEIKPVLKTLTLFELEAAALEQLWGDQAGSARVFGTVTHQHVFGMTFRLMWPLLAGRPFESELHTAWEPLLARLNPRAVIVSSPAHLTRLGGLDPLSADRRPAMVITAGAPIPESAAAEATAIFGCILTDVFGSTESGVIGWRDCAAESTLWRPFPGVEIGAGTNGVLLLRSRHASGIGWNPQADRIALSGDGRFRLEGRVDRIVKVEGKRVSLERMEHSIIALPWIAEAVVVSLGETRLYLGAVARITPSGENEIARLGKFRFERMLRRELANTDDGSVLPRRWRFVEAIPVDGMGKHRLADIRALFGNFA